jgi:hypothetical protein
MFNSPGIIHIRPDKTSNIPSGSGFGAEYCTKIKIRNMLALWSVNHSTIEYNAIQNNIFFAIYNVLHYVTSFI